jgi:hypothetical protein
MMRQQVRKAVKGICVDRDVGKNYVSELTINDISKLA